MADSVTPEQFDEIVAYYSIEPDPLDRIREVLKRGLATVAKLSGMGHPDVDEAQLAKYFDPWDRDDTETAVDAAKAERIARMQIEMAQGAR